MLEQFSLPATAQWNRGNLRTRVALVFLGLLSAVLAISLIVAGSGIDSFARSVAEREMAANARVFEDIIANRASQMRDSALVVARDFGFREAFATGDATTLTSALDSLASRSGARMAIVVGLDGETVTSNGAPQFNKSAIFAGLDKGRNRGVIALDGQLALAVAAPIEQPDLSGWLVLVQPLGTADLNQLSRLSAVPIVARVALRETLEPDLSNLPQGKIAAVDKMGEEQLVRVSAIPSLQTGITPRLVLSHSLDAAMRGYRTLKLILLAIASLGLLVGGWLSIRLSASITRPLSKLSEATGRFARGEMAKVTIEGNDEIGRLATNFNAMVDAIDERERQITHVALHDGLTGLPNRRLFIEKLDRAIARQSPSSRTFVASFDLDDFKAVNDTQGHPAGDELLQIVATRLQAVAPDALVARFGGDEFGLLLTGLPETADLAALARTICDELMKDVMLSGQPMPLTASCGIAIGPTDGLDRETLLKNSDLALYRSKGEGKGACHFFEASLDEEARRRRKLEFDLRRAIREGELELYFQPLFNLREQRIKGFEALMRWHHPDRGMVSPAEFIPVAEESGLIVEIGDWALREACRIASAWPEDIGVSVNISPRQFSNPVLLQTIVQALANSGLAPSRLELEITESIFISNVQRTIVLLEKMHALGVRIALDDFGTGYSSLSYLRSFPFDKLKIDQSFVRDLDGHGNAHAIVRAITALANALGIETLAEGVELSVQMEVLEREGCEMVQGFLISRPVPMGGVSALIEEYNDSERLRAIA